MIKPYCSECSHAKKVAAYDDVFGRELDKEYACTIEPVKIGGYPLIHDAESHPCCSKFESKEKDKPKSKEQFEAETTRARFDICCPYCDKKMNAMLDPTLMPTPPDFIRGFGSRIKISPPVTTVDTWLNISKKEASDELSR
jgi:hypothetical protein